VASIKQTAVKIRCNRVGSIFNMKQQCDECILSNTPLFFPCTLSHFINFTEFKLKIVAQGMWLLSECGTHYNFLDTLCSHNFFSLYQVRFSLNSHLSSKSADKFMTMNCRQDALSWLALHMSVSSNTSHTLRRFTASHEKQNTRQLYFILTQ
jgi:hypothetical protein